jgi:hypothetical protein
MEGTRDHRAPNDMDRKNIDNRTDSYKTSEDQKLHAE